MEKIYFENIQQTRLLDNEMAETFLSFHHFFYHQIVVWKSEENGGIYNGNGVLRNNEVDVI